MNTDQLIDRLVTDAAPVRRLLNPTERAALWTALALVAVALGVAWFGVRHDAATAWMEPGVVARVVLPRIGGVLEDRQSRIDRDLAKAAEFKAEADTVAAEYEAALAEGRAQAQGVLRKSAEAAAAVAAEKHGQLAERLVRDIKAGEERIGRAREEAVGNIRGVAAEVAQAAVERLIGVKVDGARAAAAVDSVAKETR